MGWLLHLNGSNLLCRQKPTARYSTGEGKITLNLHLLRAPDACIDDVVVHELCHLVEHNYGTGFYALMDRVMPDWRQRLEQLNQVAIM